MYSYRTAVKSELNTKQKHYFMKVHMQFYDRSETKWYKITDVMFLSNKRGPGSKTPYYQFYDVLMYPGSPTRGEDYEYMPCAEVLRHPDIAFDDRANRATVHEKQFAYASFLASTPPCDSSAAAMYVAMSSTLDPTHPTSSFDELYSACTAAIHDHATQWSLTADDCFSVMTAARVDFADASTNPCPKNVTEARMHSEPGHLASLLREIDAFARHGNNKPLPEDFDIKSIPPELILQLMPIFQKKYVGTDFAKFKCRMVVLGNRWRNIHCVDTYASMIRVDTFKVLASVAAIEDDDLVLMDVAEAYLTTKVGKFRPTAVAHEPDHTYYLRRPPGVLDSEMPYISQPESFVYGHPLANINFNKDSTEVLLDLGFVPTNYDSNVFVLHHPTFGRAILGRAVDDMPTLLRASSPELKQLIIDGISSVYTITIDDPLTTCFGIEVDRDRPNRTLTLRQRGSSYNCLNEHFPSWKTVPLGELETSPMQPDSTPLSRADRDLLLLPLPPADAAIYQSKVGHLNWITFTAPDFMYSTRRAAKTLKSPTQLCMKRVDRILSCLAYIIRSNLDGLVLGGTTGVEIIATTDTSYASGDGCKSQTGGTIHMSPSTGSVMSMCEVQSIITDSAMASEGVGGHLHLKRVLALRYFLGELGFEQSAPTKFYMDNEPFINTIVNDRGPSEKSKHILLRFQMLKEQYQCGTISLLHLATRNMVADILTKALSSPEWLRLRLVLLGQSPIIFNPVQSSTTLAD